MVCVVWFIGHYGFWWTIASCLFPPLALGLLLYAGFHDHNWWPLVIICGYGFALQAVFMIGYFAHQTWLRWRDRGAADA